jgi:hypothetical protein
MKSTFSFLSAGLGTAAIGFGGLGIGLGAKAALAQTSHYYAGLASDGQRIMVDLYSPETLSDQRVNFVYALGNEPISAQANCAGSADARTWTTLDDGVVHEPQSQGSDNMLAIVCGYSGYSTASSAEATTSASLANTNASASADLSNADETSVRTAELDTAESDIAELDTADNEAADNEAASLIPLNSAEPAVQTALVFDPPSNVRASPNGEILCSVDASTYINIYENSGSWYRTDACGQIGVIDSSQIRF